MRSLLHRCCGQAVSKTSRWRGAVLGDAQLLSMIQQILLFYSLPSFSSLAADLPSEQCGGKRS